ncbi:hypothetical protein [Magnetospirillum sp. UT-4]|uniref:hypothetical protein n=1 Tax=Magnetospirillum sp. UT-4 TaxID=2681467 RepID=UPI0013854D26|nr:hypothetical protein [Magnetospirillum sp. UT-4]CAA7627168.1 hypothetical protein MTBUT4_90111 [Magnetospirillum sp. UT-4]
MRVAAGLDWREDGDGWTAEDRTGTFRLVEVGPGQWMDFWWRREEGCGCGAPARGGRDWPDFESAAAAIVALAHAEFEAA